MGNERGHEPLDIQVKKEIEDNPKMKSCMAYLFFISIPAEYRGPRDSG